MLDTKERLLDAAERLFGETGFAETSLRDLTAAAGANLASVNYHFGGKEGLLAAVFRRRLGPVNEERMRLLDALEAEGTPVAVEKILWAFLAPPFRSIREWGEGGRHFLQLVGRFHAEPQRWTAFLRQFDLVRDRFLAALARALPHLPEPELVRRAHFVIGAMAHVFCWGPAVPELRPTGAGIPDDAVLESLIAFAAAGMRGASGRLDLDETERTGPPAERTP